ncbi:glutathione hydrolase 1 proenzyme-like [Paramacrobiotus metropolitanus]|uniref:glutathione hydrolase 1 proenzyme-like n=1 Tax=Paramacrobiotus metropolitanus TaxID=2943436 RepID=UPI002445B363|nr:glutathione hydrolase 1 proenzyme-like [Paramacrobiotus metropolitanus]
MAESNSKTERQILTNHDVLGGPRYSVGLEEVSLDPDTPHAVFSSTVGHFSSSYDGDALNIKPGSRTDKILLTLFGITASDLHGLGNILAACAIISLLILIGLIVHILIGPPQILPHGAVATDVKQCSDIGLDILKDGGSAVDAAIAAAFCIQVVNPQSSGIGGGGFMLVYDHRNKSAWYLDFRETGPAALTPGMVDAGRQKPHLLIGVPGELKGMEAAHKKFGKMSWSALISPARDLARNGFKVSTPLAKDIWRFDSIKNLPSSARLKNFLYRDGKPLQAGQTISRPDFADTLDRIARGGANEFYKGQLASEIVQEVRQLKGILTEDDLRNYQAVERQPLNASFGAYNILTAPPPSSGPAFILALNILEGFNFSMGDVKTAEYWHRYLESLKFEFANKNRLGDPDFEHDVPEIAHTMMDKKTAKELRKRIKADGVLSNYSLAANVTQPTPYGTSHISVVDSKDVYVSFTTTVNYYFGSGIMTSGGIVLNDELGDFARKEMDDEEQNNLPKPGKRPLSSMVPTVAYHYLRACTNRTAVGASNGTHIPAGVLGVLMNVLVFGMNVTDAIEYPRMFADLATNPELYEDKANVWTEKLLSDLVAWGHNMTKAEEGLNVVQAVIKNNKTITAHSDSRKYGDAAIY